MVVDKWKLPYINQNTAALLVGLTALGFAEYYGLTDLKLISYLFSVLLATLVICTMIAYTIDYALKKLDGVLI